VSGLVGYQAKTTDIHHEESGGVGRCRSDPLRIAKRSDWLMGEEEMGEAKQCKAKSSFFISLPHKRMVASIVIAITWKSAASAFVSP
jgi:hypothetical protein